MARPVTLYAPRRPVGPGRLQRRPSSNEVLETGEFHTPAWPHSLAGATGHARQIFYSFLLPLGLFWFPSAFYFPPFLHYVPYRIPDRCCFCCSMHACMVTAFPRLDLAALVQHHALASAEQVVAATVPLEDPRPRAIYSPYVHQAWCPFCEADLPPRGTPGRFWGRKCEKGGCEVIGPRPSHREWVRDAAGLGFGVRGVVCGFFFLGGFVVLCRAGGTEGGDGFDERVDTLPLPSL